jgi:LasA protease
MTSKLRILSILFLLFLLPALACNLPVGPRGKLNTSESVRRTQQAQLFPTRGPALPLEPSLAPSAPTPTQAPPASGQAHSYYAQSGDTLAAVAAHFGVSPSQVTSPASIPPSGLIPPGQPLDIPPHLPPAAYPSGLLPDSEIVDGPSAADFDIAAFIREKGGFLSTYSEQVDTEKLSGAEIIRRTAVEQSINPRLLLGLLDYTSGWVTGQPKNDHTLTYPIGFYVPQYQGLAKELSLVARMLSQGYYGWRDGSLTDLEFIGNQKVRLSPQLNAGTVALQFLFTKLLERKSWEKALYSSDGFLQAYGQLFGDPWARDAQFGALFPEGAQQPALDLPFAQGQHWSFTGGPHLSWGVGSPPGAIDLAPVTGDAPCQVSSAWVDAAAPGIVVRSERNAVALDLDGDGKEQTGWVLFYFHIADQDRVPAGSRLKSGDPIGHPSCQGGRVTGTHVHLARKYNGEWLPVGEPLPFVMSGWMVQAGKKPYDGTLTKGDWIINARPDGVHDSIVVR